ncbi:MAG: histidine kinase [Bacteroidota bacterium]
MPFFLSIYRAKKVLNTIRLLYIFICFISISQVQAQHFNFRNFGINNGLPSSFVYDVFEDSKGYLWFLTEKNVTRFDGKQFSYFNYKDGYDETGLFRVVEDKAGTLWFLTTTFKIFAFKNGTFTKVKSNDKFGWVDIGFDKKVKIISRDGRKLYQVNDDFTLSPIPINNKKAAYNFVEIKHNEYLIGTTVGVLLLTNNGTKEILPANTHSKRVVPRIFKTKDAIFLTNETGIFKYNPNNYSVQLQLPLYNNDEVFNIYEEEDNNNIWVCSLNGLFKYKKTLSSSVKPEGFFENTPVHSICKSKDNLFWISTYANGTFVCDFNSKHLTQKEIGENEKILYVKNLNEKIYFFNQNIYTCALSNNKLEKLNISHDKNVASQERFFEYATSFKDSFIFVKGSANFFINKNGITKYEVGNTNKIGDSLIYFDMKWNQGITMLSEKGISQHTPNNVVVPFYKYNMIESFLVKNDIYIDNIKPVYLDKDTVYLASNKGLIKLYLINNKIAYNIKAINGKIAHVTKYNNQLIVSTYTNGIYLINQNNIVNITSIEGLPSDYTTESVVNDNRIWVCTNKGLSRIDLNNLNNITNFTSLDYLIDNEVNDIAFFKDTVYVATSKGLSFFPQRIIFKDKFPSVFLEKFEINNQDTIIRDTYYLPYTNNNFTFHFSSPSYRSGNNNIFQFVIKKGNHYDTNYYQSGTIQLSSLIPGAYQFFICVKNIDGLWSINPKIINITVLPPLWDTFMFKIVAVAVILIVVIIMVVGTVKGQKQKQEYNRKIVESELKSLRLYMNPHFIFNSLSSLQSFVLTNEIDKANNYITKFSKLIRSVMSYSVKGEINLKDEIKLLQSYLELEKERFGNSFNFQISYSDELFAEHIVIPSLMIQPFVENAIKHGITGLLARVGVIKVKFEKRDNDLYCIVEDNGRGIDKDKQKDGLYVSSGINFTEERIRLLLNEPNKEVIKIIDLQEKNQQVGTRVEILVPVLNKGSI